MAEPGWTFAPNGNGEEHGFHNPGVETFKDNLERYLAREAIQNSIDARLDLDNPVEVTFELLDVARSEIPAMDELADALKRCSSYWAKDAKAKAFFDRAHKLAQAKVVSCLRIGDANTTGVPGGDAERELGWYNLVRSSGSSAKAAGAGGSFGLGKHAPFAASRLLTVFYSTRLEDASSAFQGVTRLVTHDGAEGRRQPTGFLGGPNGRSIRNKKDIPKAFRREESGTDVYVLGYHADEAWEDEIVYSVLENFWPAIHRGDLTVTAGDTTVSKDNLAALLAKYSTDHKDFEAHLYYRAYTDTAPKTEQTTLLPVLGEASTYFLSGDQAYPNRVAMVRATGMVVYHRRGRSRVPYVGVFECCNEVGNEVLRQMEPPRHDDWNPDLPEKGENRKAKKVLDDTINARIKGLAPASTEKTIVIPDLSQYLPDDGDTPDEAFDGPPADGVGKNESFDRKTKTQPIPGQNLAKKQPTHPGGGSSGAGDNSGEGDDEGDTGGDSNEGDGGDKGSKGGGEGGAAGGSNGRHPVLVRSRAFMTDPATGVYSLTVHPPQQKPTGDVFLAVAAVGDDSLPVPVRLQAARVPGGKKLEVPALGRVGPVAFPKTAPLRVEVTLAEPRRLSLQVTAEEVASDAAQ
ncbi:Uncharacterized protein (Fragment) OS=Lysinibacillus fusiformis ZB2 GN=C518_4451 PE=4 SV=1 [Gemmataceae bacterium]